MPVPAPPRLGSVAYAAVLVAWVSPPAFAGAIWGDIFAFRHGVLNAALGSIGLGRVDMLGEHPMLAVILADVWRGTAFSMIIFLGALQTIPRGVHEAARLDGASAFQRLRDHTIPLLSHIGAIVLTMTTITTMGAFMLILLLTNGDPAYQTETLALFAFHARFRPTKSDSERPSRSCCSPQSPLCRDLLADRAGIAMIAATPLPAAATGRTGPGRLPAGWPCVARFCWS